MYCFRLPVYLAPSFHVRRTLSISHGSGTSCRLIPESVVAMPSDQHGIALLRIPECYKFDSPLISSVWFPGQPFHRGFLSSACAERRRLLVMIVKGCRVEGMAAQCIRVVLARCRWCMEKRLQEDYCVKVKWLLIAWMRDRDDCVVLAWCRWCVEKRLQE